MSGNAESRELTRHRARQFLQQTQSNGLHIESSDDRANEHKSPAHSGTGPTTPSRVTIPPARNIWRELSLPVPDAFPWVTSTLTPSASPNASYAQIFHLDTSESNDRAIVSYRGRLYRLVPLAMSAPGTPDFGDPEEARQTVRGVTEVEQTPLHDSRDISPCDRRLDTKSPMRVYQASSSRDPETRRERSLPKDLREEQLPKRRRGEESHSKLSNPKTNGLSPQGSLSAQPASATLNTSAREKASVTSAPQRIVKSTSQFGRFRMGQPARADGAAGLSRVGKRAEPSRSVSSDDVPLTQRRATKGQAPALKKLESATKRNFVTIENVSDDDDGEWLPDSSR